MPANTRSVTSASGFLRTVAILSYATLPKPVSTSTREYIIRINGTASRTRTNCMVATVRT